MLKPASLLSVSVPTKVGPCYEAQGLKPVSFLSVSGPTKVGPCYEAQGLKPLVAMLATYLIHGRVTFRLMVQDDIASAVAKAMKASIGGA